MASRTPSVLDITLTSSLRVLNPETSPRDDFVASNSHILRISLNIVHAGSGEQISQPISVEDSRPPAGTVPPVQSPVEYEDIKSKAFLDELAALEANQSEYPPIRQEDVGYHSHSPEDEEIWIRNVMLIRRLRKIVADDQKLPAAQRIDAVEIGPDPWPEHILALDGLNPKHLAVFAGFEEEGDVGAVDQLKKPWAELRSLQLNNVSGWLQTVDENGEDEMDGIPYPNFISQIDSLTLNYCYGFLFTAKHLPVTVKHLKIVGDDATNTFCAAVENVPGLSTRLESLHLTSNTYQEYDTSLELKQALLKCEKLKNLTLNLGGEYVVEDRKVVLAEYQAAKQARLEAGDVQEDEDPDSDEDDDILDHHEDNDTGLCPFIPNSVEKLSFHCSLSTTMLSDLDAWIEHSADADWLPHLKQLTIRPDGPHLELHTPRISRLSFDDNPDQLARFDDKVNIVFSNLKARQPTVEVSR